MTRRSAPVSASPSRSSAERAPAVSPCARLWAASLSAVPAAPSACDAVASSSASWRASSRCCSGVISSSLSPSSSRSSRAFSGSPSRFSSGLPVAALERARLSAVSDAARCSLAGSTWARTSVSIAPSRARFASRSSGRSRKLAREVAQLLGQSRPRIVRVLALVVEVVGDSIDPLGLAVGRLADLLLLGDDRVLRVRQQRSPARAGGRRPARPPRAAARSAAGTGRPAPGRSSAPHRGAAGGRTGRSRRLRRAGPATPAASVGRPRPGRPRPGTRRPARAHSRPGRRAHPRRRRPAPSRRSVAGRGPRRSASRAARASGMAAASTGRARAARSGRPSTGRVRRRRPRQARSSPRRTSRRTHSRRRIGEQAAAQPDEFRVERPVERRERIRRHDGRCLLRRPEPATERGAERHQAAPSLRRAPRRRRQRRVGETNWTDSSRNAIDSRNQAADGLLPDPRIGDLERDGSGAHDDGVDGDPPTPRSGAIEHLLLDRRPDRSDGVRRSRRPSRIATARVRAVDEDDPVLVEQERLAEPAVVAQRRVGRRTGRRSARRRPGRGTG